MTRKRDKPFGGQLTTAAWLTSSNSAATETSVRLDQIHLPAHQPRRYFDAPALQQLVQSIQQHGILQPLLVRPHPVDGYELVAGERRYRAAQTAKLETIPVVIRELSDVEAFQLALIENLQREDLNSIEETEGILQLLAFELEQPIETLPTLLRSLFNDISRSQPGNPDDAAGNNVIIDSRAEADNNVIICPPANEQTSEVPSTVQEIVKTVFDQLGKMSWESFVTNRLPLLNLPQDILQALRQGKIAYTKAKIIARVKDPEQRTALLKSAINKNLSLSQIKEQIQSPAKTTENIPLQAKLTATYRQVKKAKIWEDPGKRTRLETLLNELEALLSS